MNQRLSNATPGISIPFSSPHTYDFQGSRLRLVICNHEAWFAVNDVLNAVIQRVDATLLRAVSTSSIDDDDFCVVSACEHFNETTSGGLKLVREASLFVMLAMLAQTKDMPDLVRRAKSLKLLIQNTIIPDVRRKACTLDDSDTTLPAFPIPTQNSIKLPSLIDLSDEIAHASRALGAIATEAKRLAANCQDAAQVLCAHAAIPVPLVA